MDQLVDQSRMFRPEYSDSASSLNDAEFSFGLLEGQRLPPALSILLMVTISAILWAGLIFSADRVWHWLYHVI
jgi:hypothetical protein